jgi:hypothetical protein
MEMAGDNAFACPLPRRHHWLILKTPCPPCRFIVSAEKGTKQGGDKMTPMLQALLHACWASLLQSSYWLVPVLQIFGVSYVHGLSAVVSSGFTCSLSRSSSHKGTARKTLACMSLSCKNCQTRRRIGKVQWKYAVWTYVDWSNFVHTW